MSEAYVNEFRNGRAIRPDAAQVKEMIRKEVEGILGSLGPQSSWSPKCQQVAASERQAGDPLTSERYENKKHDKAKRVSFAPLWGSDDVANDTPLMDTGLDWVSIHHSMHFVFAACSVSKWFSCVLCSRSTCVVFRTVCQLCNSAMIWLATSMSSCWMPTSSYLCHALDKCILKYSIDIYI